MDIGYIRVSTTGQNTDRQLENIKSKLDKIFEEKLSAKTIDRPQLNAAIEFCREGDTLHVHSLDRVCRSGVSDALALIDKLKSKGVSTHFHKENIIVDATAEKTDHFQSFILSMFAAFAEMERALINERRAEGVAIAVAKGKKFGRPKKDVVTSENIKKAMDLGYKKKCEIAKYLGVERTTIYRFLKANNEK